MSRSRTTTRRRSSRKHSSTEKSHFMSPLSIGLCEATHRAKDPVAAILRYARELIRQSGIVEPPFRPAILAALRNVDEIVYKRIEEEGRLIPKESGAFRIELRIDRPFTRTNFTCAHEIAHTFFYEAVPAIKYRRLQEAIRDTEEELLCNIAASEMLMPTKSITEIASRYSPSPDSLLKMSEIYETSLTATAVRVLSLKLWDAKFILWDCSDSSARALWFARPSKALAHYPEVQIENYGTSGIRAAFCSPERTESDDWLCIERRFTYCRIRSFRLPHSTRVLSCIGNFRDEQRHSDSQQLSISVQYQCECNGTGTRIIHLNGRSYGMPCRSVSHTVHPSERTRSA